ncbi:MAG: hypothetical protein QM764_03740 [Chitinophagaceae bacterium]
MKKLLFTMLVLGGCFCAKAQFTNHKFEGTLHIDNQDTPVTLDFKKDTVNALITTTGEVLEQMLYTAKNGVVTFKKVTGKSTCGSDIVGKYKYAMKNNAITLKVAEDLCGDRAGVLDQTSWKKAK